MERLFIPTRPNSNRSLEVYKASSIADLLRSKDDVIADKYPSYALFLKQHSTETDLGRPNYYRHVIVMLTSVKHDPDTEQPSTDRHISIFDQTGELEVSIPRSIINLFRRVQNPERYLDFKALKEEPWLGDVVLSTSFCTVGKDTHQLLQCTRRYRQEKVRPDPLWARLLPRLTPKPI
jgi:hypothetical protein